MWVTPVHELGVPDKMEKKKKKKAERELMPSIHLSLLPDWAHSV